MITGTWKEDEPSGAGKWRSKGISVVGRWAVGDAGFNATVHLAQHAFGAQVREAHAAVTQHGVTAATCTTWRGLFRHPECPYDDTARRMDQRLTDSLAEANSKEEEGVLIANHLMDVLQHEVHPHGVVLAKFCACFRQSYPARPSGLIRQVELLLHHAIADLRNFTIEMREYMCGNMTSCLNTKQRKRHGHSVLLDVMFPMIYACLWVLYCSVWRDKDKEIARRIETLTASSCMQLGVKPQLCLQPTLSLRAEQGPSAPGDVPTTTPSEGPPCSTPAQTTPAKKMLTISVPRSPATCSSDAPRVVRMVDPPGNSSGPLEAPAELFGDDDVLLPPPSPSPVRSNSMATSPNDSPSALPYWDAIAVLRRLPEYRSPPAKIECLKLCSVAILSCIDDFFSGCNQGLTVGAEDKFPIVLYVVIQAQVPNLAAECAFMSDALDDRTRNVSEAGYRVTELQAVLDHLEKMEVRGGQSGPAARGEDEASTWDSPLSPGEVALDV